MINTDPSKGAVFPVCAAVLLFVIVVVLGSSVLYVLWPTKDWCYVASASIILKKANAGDSEDVIRRYVTEAMIDGAQKNNDMLRRKQDAFRIAVVMLVLEVLLLIGALIFQLKG